MRPCRFLAVPPPFSPPFSPPLSPPFPLPSGAAADGVRQLAGRGMEAGRRRRAGKVRPAGGKKQTRQTTVRPKRFAIDFRGLMADRGSFSGGLRTDAAGAHASPQPPVEEHAIPLPPPSAAHFAAPLLSERPLPTRCVCSNALQGDCLFFHNLVLHGSGSHTVPDFVRWAIDLRYERSALPPCLAPLSALHPPHSSPRG